MTARSALGAEASKREQRHATCRSGRTSTQPSDSTSRSSAHSPYGSEGPPVARPMTCTVIGTPILEATSAAACFQNCHVRSRYLIGADGARSRILEAAGLAIEGPAALGHAVNVWFEADL